MIAICFHAAEHFQQNESAAARTLCPVCAHYPPAAARGGEGWRVVVVVVVVVEGGGGGVHYSHAFLRPMKGNDGCGDCGDSAPAAVRVRHTDGRGDQSITALTGVLLLY